MKDYDDSRFDEIIGIPYSDDWIDKEIKRLEKEMDKNIRGVINE